jgi:hypothetical protein
MDSTTMDSTIMDSTIMDSTIMDSTIMDSTNTGCNNHSKEITRDLVEEFQSFWNTKQINAMILAASARNPKSQTTVDCVELLKEMTLSDSDLDQGRIFAILCVLNNGPIFATVDPHVITTRVETPVVTTTPQVDTNEAVIDVGDTIGGTDTLTECPSTTDEADTFALDSIDDELLKMLSEV